MYLILQRIYRIQWGRCKEYPNKNQPTFDFRHAIAITDMTSTLLFSNNGMGVRGLNGVSSKPSGRWYMLVVSAIGLAECLGHIRTREFTLIHVNIRLSVAI